MRSRPLPKKRWGLRLLFKVVAVLFMLFVAYKILTPRAEVLMQVVSPDGKNVARLRVIYYSSDPVYKIDYHATQEWAWRCVFIHSIESASPKTVSIKWSKNSKEIGLFLHEKPFWKYEFENKKQKRLK
jgi:hypothetical protein